MVLLSLSPEAIASLDLSPAETVIEAWLSVGSPDALIAQEQSLQFAIQFPREPEDPRELSEIPAVRLWFVRLDSRYPWLPFFLDWKGGELARYTAMLVPHQFHRTEGIQFNSEALEIFVMNKVFVLQDWFRHWQIPAPERLKFFAQMLGYDLESEFLEG
jgi:hypothetical protein